MTSFKIQTVSPFTLIIYVTSICCHSISPFLFRLSISPLYVVILFRLSNFAFLISPCQFRLFISPFYFALQFSPFQFRLFNFTLSISPFCIAFLFRSPIFAFYNFAPQFRLFFRVSISILFFKYKLVSAFLYHFCIQIYSRLHSHLDAYTI